MIYRFGNYELDLQLYELRQAGIPLRIEPKVFDVLTYLVQHRDSVVSKHELLEHMWANQYISEATLSGCIMAARRAVGDSGRRQEVIQTLHGRGYRFIAPITEQASTTGNQAAVCEPPRPDAPLSQPLALRHLSDIASNHPEPAVAPPPETVHCPTCQQPNESGATFCVTCGTQVRHTCPHCQHMVRLPAAFCPSCGEPLAMAPSELPAIYPLSRFIGREHELATLHHILAQVRQGHGQAVALVGGVAIGKSWLLNEFRRSLAERNVLCLEGSCPAQGRLLPYGPITEIIRQHLGLPEIAGALLSVEDVQQQWREAGKPVPEQVPYLLRLLGFHDAARVVTRQQPATLRSRTREAFWHMLLAASRQQPVVVTIEDVQEIDAASVDCLSVLLDHLASAPILFLVTYRPEYDPPWLPQANVTRLAVPALSPEESLRLVHTLLPPARLSPALEQVILARAAGNPLFLEQVTRLITEQPQTSGAVIPDAIRGVIMARLEQLSETAWEVLQAAAVIGRTFAVRLLTAIWTGTGSVDAALLELERRSLCYERHDVVPPTYVFKHALIQEVAYKSLRVERRQVLHAAIAAWLEREEAEQLDGGTVALAGHYAAAGQAVRAVQHLLHCADVAARQGAHPVVIALLQEALVQVDDLPAWERERQRLALVLRHAQALLQQGRGAETTALLLPQQTSLERCDDVALQGHAALVFAQAASSTGAWEAAARYAQQAGFAATACHDHTTLGQAYQVLAMERYWSKRPLEGVAYGQQVIALWQDAEVTYHLGLAYFVLGLNFLLCGDLEQALMAEAHAQEIATVLQEPQLQTCTAWANAWILATRGEPQSAIVCCQQALEYAPDSLNRALALGWWGYALLEDGKGEEASGLLEQAIGHMQRLQYRRLEGFYDFLLGESYLLQNQPEQALALVQQGLDIAQATADRFAVAWGQRALGKIARARGSLPLATRHMQQALAHFADIPAHFEVARTHLIGAELAHVQGHAETVAEHLTAAYQLFAALSIRHYTEHTRRQARSYGVSIPELPTAL